MKKDTRPTRVIFRKFPEGDVIALMPEHPGDSNYFATFSSYQHVGQHGSASTGIVEVTTPATPKEYASLLAELESIGYNVKIAQRVTMADFKRRRFAVRGY